MPGTYTKLFYHIVFSTKDRQPFIDNGIEAELHKYMGGITHGIGGSSLEINGMPEHVHILAILPPKIASVGSFAGHKGEFVEVGARNEIESATVRLARWVLSIFS